MWLFFINFAFLKLAKINAMNLKAILSRNMNWKWCVAMLMLLSANYVHAQMDSCLFERDYHIDPANEGELNLEIDNVSFFKDNEWDNRVSSGYTLPGLWVQPKVTYNACKNLRLEAGVNALIYAGTTKYPNVMYKDIAVWKGDQYMEGTHLNPFFRASIKLGAVHFVLGDIYGGANHHLIDPLFSQELNLTSDPEMGLQMLLDLKKWHLDVWANWQSFIFKNDHHREAFIFGLSSESWLNSHKSNVSVSVPVNVVMQHRGGEIDTITVNSVNTLMNGSVGLRVKHNIYNSWLNYWQVEADAVGYYQESGEMFNKSKGWGLYAKGQMALKCGLGVKLGYMHMKDFISLLGYPYYGAISVRDLYNHAAFKKPRLVTLQVDWVKSFGKHYAFGARGEMFQYFTGGSMTTTKGEVINQKNTSNFSFGVFLRANPTFLLKKF